MKFRTWKRAALEVSFFEGAAAERLETAYGQFRTNYAICMELDKIWSRKPDNVRKY